MPRGQKPLCLIHFIACYPSSNTPPRCAIPFRALDQERTSNREWNVKRRMEILIIGGFVKLLIKYAWWQNEYCNLSMTRYSIINTKFKVWTVKWQKVWMLNSNYLCECWLSSRLILYKALQTCSSQISEWEEEGHGDVGNAVTRGRLNLATVFSRAVAMLYPKRYGIRKFLSRFICHIL